MAVPVGKKAPIGSPLTARRTNISRQSSALRRWRLPPALRIFCPARLTSSLKTGALFGDAADERRTPVR